MKLRIDTAGVSFVCTRAPEQRIAFDTGQAENRSGDGFAVVAGPADGAGHLRWGCHRRDCGG